MINPISGYSAYTPYSMNPVSGYGNASAITGVASEDESQKVIKTLMKVM